MRLELLKLDKCQSETPDHELNLMAFTLVLGLMMMLPLIIAWFNWISRWFGGAAATSHEHAADAPQAGEPVMTELPISSMVGEAADASLLDSSSLDNALLRAGSSADPPVSEVDDSGMPKVQQCFKTFHTFTYLVAGSNVDLDL